MTHAAGLKASFDDEPSRSVAQDSRTAAFQAAQRHSRRVRTIRRGIFVGCVAAIMALIYFGFFRSASIVPSNVSAAGVAIHGSRITIANPRLSGFKGDGRPYQLRAATGVQDIKKPSIVELNDVDAHVTLPDKSVLRLSAPFGVYDSVKDFMHLTRDVHVVNESGYDARLQNADLDFKAGTIVSNDPVTVTLTSGDISANAIAISGNGARILFTGDVHSTMTPASASEPAGSAPVQKAQQ